MLKLEARPGASKFWSYASPILALLITVLIGITLFVALGKDPVKGLQVFFWEPIKTPRALGELMVKATPLLVIALGLAVCFRSNVWRQEHGCLDRRAHFAGGGRGGHGLGRRHGGAARQVQRQRDSGEPDARVCGHPVPGLYCGRPLERPEWL